MSTLANPMTHDSHGHAGGHGHKPRMTMLSWLSIGAGAIAVAWLIWHSLTAAHGDHGGHAETHLPHLWGIGILPFVGILGGIALLPLLPFSHHWWESNQNRFAVAVACAGLTVISISSCLTLSRPPAL